MLKFGTRERYSLHLMLALAQLSDDEAPVHLGEVSSWTGISRRYLEQLVIPLKNASLIRGRSGRSGGYTLSRDPSEIKIGEIIEAAAGPVAVSECVVDERVCRNIQRCHCRPLWISITKRIRGVLDDFSLAELAEPVFEDERETGAEGDPFDSRGDSRTCCQPD